MSALPLGATIGILGGGQLGRMLALAAVRMGFRVHVFAPEADSPAFDVSAVHTVATYEDKTALAAFASAVDVVTYEFENVPVATVRFLEERTTVRPGSKALETAQDRINEKTLARSLGAMTADFDSVASLEELKDCISKLGAPGILKTTRLGYDGKGQARINNAADAEAAWLAMRGQPAIYERFVNFNCEVSVILARGVDRKVAAFDVVENVHRDGVLFTSTVPARISPELAVEAVFVAQRLAEALDYVGIMGVEFFVGDDVIYVNEIAPRVHNSGHWTEAACTISQFEQHIRAVAGWPLGTTRRHSNAVMTNLLGDEIGQTEKLASESDVLVHAYGKREARRGRKMGHFTRLFPVS